jgi:lipoyl(octanoyl) transferase
VSITVRRLGLVGYQEAWEAMRRFTDERDDDTLDELWLLQHPPVYTLGLAGRTEHLLDTGDIPVIACDRGGQVTYHGPGQVIMYVLLNLRRRGLGVRQLVSELEGAVIETLGSRGVEAEHRPGAPGVYVGGAKVAALGLRIRRGCSYHGLALNVDMNLEPFLRINPCGFPGLAVTQLVQLGLDGGATEWGDALAACLQRRLARFARQPQR